MIRRRDFTTLLGGAAAWPLAARAQRGGRIRRIGVLMPYDENDPQSKSNVVAFTQPLAGLGWTDDRSVRIDLRWAGADINRIRAFAQELVGLQPDIILTNATVATVALPMAATCGWTFVGAAVTPIGYERSRRSWSACNPTHSGRLDTRTIPIVFGPTPCSTASRCSRLSFLKIGR